MLSKQLHTAYSSSAWKLGIRLISIYNIIASGNTKCGYTVFRQDKKAKTFIGINH
jgi:hypothetical protein